MLGYFYTTIFYVARLVLVSVVGIILFDILLLFRFKNGIEVTRKIPPRFSNGDDNEVKIILNNKYPFPIKIRVIDELPYQFQKRDFFFKVSFSFASEKEMSYKLRPLERGEYYFGIVNVYVYSFLGIIARRYKLDEEKMVPVYPSFIQMRKFEFLAISNQMENAGIKRIRQRGTHSEFDQVKEYVAGDDYRTMNWKATARKGTLMVNQYQDEKSKEVYCIIDKGRVMEMPFDGLSLLDYSINASLILSNIALLKQDKAGIITYNTEVDNIIQADRRTAQLSRIMEVLYNQKTEFKESNTDLLYLTLKKKIHQRSLLILFSNFESLVSVRRHMISLAQLAKHHLILLIIFENREISEMIDEFPNSSEKIYQQVIAQKFLLDKKIITRELNQHGIHALLTQPQDLNVNLINKYLEYKSLGIF